MQNRTYRIGMSQTLYQFVGDIAYFKARNNQHICITCNGRTRSFAGTDFRNQCCVSLQLTVDSNIRSHFFSNLQGFYHFVYHFVFCRTFCRETQQRHFRINACDSLSRTCSTNSDLRQLRSIGVTISSRERYFARAAGVRSLTPSSLNTATP